MRSVLLCAVMVGLRIFTLASMQGMFVFCQERAQTSAQMLSILYAMVYGLQALMQIPLARWSDTWGRVRVLRLSALLFCVGSLISVLWPEVLGVLALGRILQAVGAVGGVVMAYIADETQARTRVWSLALVGAVIGLSASWAALFSVYLVSWWPEDAMSVQLKMAVGASLLMLLCAMALQEERRDLGKASIPVVPLADILRIQPLKRVLQGLFLCHGMWILGSVHNQRIWASWDLWQGSFSLSFLLGVLAVVALLSAALRRWATMLWLQAVAAGVQLMGFVMIFMQEETLMLQGLGYIVMFVGFALLECLCLAQGLNLIPKNWGSGQVSGWLVTFQFLGSGLGGILPWLLQPLFIWGIPPAWGSMIGFILLSGAFFVIISKLAHRFRF